MRCLSHYCVTVHSCGLSLLSCHVLARRRSGAHTPTHAMCSSYMVIFELHCITHRAARSSRFVLLPVRGRMAVVLFSYTQWVVMACLVSLLHTDLQESF